MLQQIRHWVQSFLYSIGRPAMAGSPSRGRLAVEEDMRVVFSGKAVSEEAVLEVLDHLKASPRFTDVKPLYLRESGRSQREVTFAMSCRFVEGSFRDGFH